MAELQRGVVKWFNDAKGFGFIEHTSGRDVFVHYSVIEWDGFKTLKDGEEVHYELSEGDKGLHASKVVRLVPSEENGQTDGTAIETDRSNHDSTMPELEVQSAVSASSSEGERTPSMNGGDNASESLSKP